MLNSNFDIVPTVLVFLVPLSLQYIYVSSQAEIGAYLQQSQAIVCKYYRTLLYYFLVDLSRCLAKVASCLPRSLCSLPLLHWRPLQKSPHVRMAPVQLTAVEDAVTIWRRNWPRGHQQRGLNILIFQKQLPQIMEEATMSGL